MKTTNRLPLAPLFICTVLLFSFGCNAPEKDKGALPLALPDMHVTATELNCATDEFASKVHYGNSGIHNSLTATTIMFNKESYDNIANPFKEECTGTAGMVIHYGFDPESKKLVHAFSFVCMTDEDAEEPGIMFKYEVPESPLYFTVDNALEDTNSTLSDWKDTWGKGFQENIVVDKYDNKGFQKIYAGQAGHMVYKLDQLDVLFADNGTAAFVEVVPIAEPEVWPTKKRGAIFSMKTCLVARDGADRLIDDTTNEDPNSYSNKGSDLGAACPPLCNDVAVFLKSGIDVRESCKSKP